MVKQAHTPPPLPARPDKAPAQTLSSAELMQGRREIVIEHLGERYRLQQTRNGKLILTK
ncbi:MAG: hemin uptake protein HemP [Zoogloeaceae bacterium]|nr:hemin uptake protein HemP [Zoogloeaceae bacterium]MCK6385527.1 hemin uptake protein HemP [Rhodocyclaceae bacterium]